MKLELAKHFANDFLQKLMPACVRGEIVGSVKRADKPEVHDIEILLIAKDEKPVPEFGKPQAIYTSKLQKVLADLEYGGYLRQAARKADGDRYKKRAIIGSGELNEFCLDLFIVSPETWGLQNVIRTGPSLFSHAFVTNQNQQILDRATGSKYAGLLPNHLEYIRGETVIKNRKTGEVLLLPEEQDAIAVLGHGWIEPAQRRFLVK
jgi:DNA polymerase/3'-5' exonuclease PolX